MAMATDTSLDHYESLSKNIHFAFGSGNEEKQTNCFQTRLDVGIYRVWDVIYLRGQYGQKYLVVMIVCLFPYVLSRHEEHNKKSIQKNFFSSMSGWRTSGERFMRFTVQCSSFSKSMTINHAMCQVRTLITFHVTIMNGSKKFLSYGRNVVLQFSRRNRKDTKTVSL